MSDATATCVRYLTGLLKLIKLHDGLNNVVFSQQIPPFLEALAEVLENEKALHVEARESLVLSNKRIVKGIGQQNAEEFHAALSELGMSAVWIGRVLEEDELRRVLQILQREGGAEDPSQKILEGIDSFGLQTKVRFVPIGESGGTAEETVVRVGDAEYFPLAYGRLLVLLREFARNAEDAELSRYFRQKLHRAAGELARLVGRYPQRLMALTTIKAGDELFTRLANTGLLALLLGARLGLSRKQLADLALSAFLQGVGESFAEEGGEREFGILREFTRGRDLSAKALCTTVVALAPSRTEAAQERHPYARIVAVCVEFEALVFGRDGEAQIPAEAVQTLLEREGKDELIVKAFANLVGVYPIGSCVRLSNQQVGVVVHTNPGFPGRPLVAVAKDAEGNPVDGDLVDLAEKDVRDEFRLTIEATLDAGAEGVQVSDFLLG